MPFLTQLVVMKIGDRTWMVDQPLRYDYLGEVLEVPCGFETDFASVPRGLWNVFPPDGRHTPGAVVHDFLYTTHIKSRKESDQIFLQAMKELGVSWWRRHAMYRAVRIFGGGPYRRGYKPKPSEV